MRASGHLWFCGLDGDLLLKRQAGPWLPALPGACIHDSFQRPLVRVPLDLLGTCYGQTFFPLSELFT